MAMAAPQTVVGGAGDKKQGQAELCLCATVMKEAWVHIQRAAGTPHSI